jgi:hypothetical protein
MSDRRKRRRPCQTGGGELCWMEEEATQAGGDSGGLLVAVSHLPCEHLFS